jgi:SAM-dependent methyltransferase
MPKIDYYINTYDYFCRLNNGPITDTVLDYGSNYGLFLHSSKNQFDEKNYTGIDVDLEAIEYGKSMFPKATFIHYNKHNYMYNPQGQNLLWPCLDTTFDTIISYSVITHTTVDDFINAVSWLYKHLNHNGKMFITYLDITNTFAKSFFYNKRVRDFGSCDEITTEDYVYIVDNKVAIPNNNSMLLTFYNENYLSKILSNYNFKLIQNFSNKAECFQDCIIIKKPTAG